MKRDADSVEAPVEASIDVAVEALFMVSYCGPLGRGSWRGCTSSGNVDRSGGL